MSNTIFDIEQKQDSAERLEAVQGIETKFVLFADEFNDVARKAVESAIENFAVEFSWSNKKSHYINNRNGVDKIQLLVMRIKENWILNAVDKCELIIERYRPKRKVRTTNNNIDGIERFKESGFRKPMFPDDMNIDRPSEILITDNEMVLDFGQEHYFILSALPDNIRAKGSITKNNNSRYSQVILRFKVRITIGDKVYLSGSKAVVKLTMAYQNQLTQDNHLVPKITVSYKRM